MGIGCEVGMETRLFCHEEAQEEGLARGHAAHAAVVRDPVEVGARVGLVCGAVGECQHAAELGWRLGVVGHHLGHTDIQGRAGQRSRRTGQCAESKESSMAGLRSTMSY